MGWKKTINPDGEWEFQKRKTEKENDQVTGY